MVNPVSTSFLIEKNTTHESDRPISTILENEKLFTTLIKAFAPLIAIKIGDAIYARTWSDRIGHLSQALLAATVGVVWYKVMIFADRRFS